MDQHHQLPLHLGSQPHNQTIHRLPAGSNLRIVLDKLVLLPPMEATTTTTNTLPIRLLFLSIRISLFLILILHLKLHATVHRIKTVLLPVTSASSRSSTYRVAPHKRVVFPRTLTGRLLHRQMALAKLLKTCRCSD